VQRLRSRTADRPLRAVRLDAHHSLAIADETAAQRGRGSRVEFLIGAGIEIIHMLRAAIGPFRDVRNGL